MERAAAADCVALAFVGGLGGHRLVAPFGGAEGLLGPNPLAAGFPSESGQPIIVDFSTAELPVGKVMVAAKAGRALPSQALIDREGQPTDDPNALEAGGAMRTFGGHKGFGLAVLLELIGRVLLVTEAAGDGDLGGPSFRRHGLVLVVVAADAFRDLPDVLAEAAALQADINGVRPAAGFDRVLAPGQPEQASRARHSAQIPISAGTWSEIRETALDVGIAQAELPEAQPVSTGAPA